MLVAALVVAQRAALGDFVERGQLDDAPTSIAGLRRLCREIEGVQRDSRVAVAERDEEVEGGVFDIRAKRGEAALLVAQRPGDDGPQVVLAERLQGKDAGARKQRRDDLERRVLRGGPDEGDRALLDVGQNRVLLRLVEAMDLVDEEQGAPPGVPRPRPEPR